MNYCQKNHVLILFYLFFLSIYVLSINIEFKQHSQSATITLKFIPNFFKNSSYENVGISNQLFSIIPDSGIYVVFHFFLY